MVSNLIHQSLLDIETKLNTKGEQPDQVSQI